MVPGLAIAARWHGFAIELSTDALNANYDGPIHLRMRNQIAVRSYRRCCDGHVRAFQVLLFRRRARRARQNGMRPIASPP